MACATFEEICHAYENRPAVLRQAIALCYNHPEFRSFTRETIGILVSLLARVSHFKPGAPFYARADRCADEIGVNRKTFTRSIERFVDQGLITTRGGGRTKRGRFGALRYQFTIGFLGKLGIGGRRPKEARTEVSHGYLYIDLQSKEDHVPACASAEENPQTKPTYNPLPADVAPLETRGVNPLLVYRLMGMAGHEGYRLGDMLVVALPFLEKLNLTGWRAYSYVAAMLTKGKGYGQKAQVQRDDEQRKQAIERRNTLEQRLEGKRFVSQGGIRVTIRGGVVVNTHPDGRVDTMAGGGGLEAVQSALEAGRLLEVS